MHNPELVLENETHKLLDTNGSPNLDQKTKHRDNQQHKKRTCRIVDFAISTDHRVKLKESEKKDNYQVLIGKGKKL